jgi:LacI family transcriptional regulator
MTFFYPPMSGSSSQRPITQRDIADALGVSIAAVSLALRNSPELSEARRREIQELAGRMGYRPNSAAAELAGHKRGSAACPIVATMAWINTWRPAARLRSYRHFDGYWRGAEEAAAKFGYRLEEFQLGRGLHPMRLHEILEARGIRGILLPPQPGQPQWDDFPWERYSVVKFGRSLSDPACHVVSSDQVANAMKAFQMIRANGYRRIGFLTKEERVQRGGHLFEAGILMSLRFVAEDERVPILVLTETDRPTRVRSLQRWLEAHRVEAVFTDVAEAPALLEAAGLRVPEDVALAAANVADIGIPAGIDQHPAEIGRVGVLLLHALMTTHECGTPEIARQVLVDGSWVDGASLPVRRAESSPPPAGVG